MNNHDEERCKVHSRGSKPRQFAARQSGRMNEGDSTGAHPLAHPQPGRFTRNSTRFSRSGARLALVWPCLDLLKNSKRVSFRLFGLRKEKRGFDNTFNTDTAFHYAFHLLQH